MIRPARNIRDTRIQCVCGIIAAREKTEIEVFMCATFAQATLDPPRIIINPNRIYPIDGMIRRAGRFSVSLLADAHRPAVLRLIRLRRRQLDKARLAGLALSPGSEGPPWITDAIRTLFCEVEAILDSGDHTIMIGRVMECRENPNPLGKTPLLYREVAGEQPERGAVARRLRRGLVRTGLPDLARRVLARVRTPPPADLPKNTYQDGGFTDQEIGRILRYDVIDRGRRLEVPPRIPGVSHQVGVCVVGTHWGETQCAAVRGAAPRARLFVCGRDPIRTARLAHRTGAEGHFVGIESALADPRVQAVVLTLPHHLHREATEAALAAGKHVLVEKPIAPNLEDADRMLEAGRKSGRILMVAENMHFRPSLGLVAERIAAGHLGEPLHLLVHAGTVRRDEGWVTEKAKLGGGVFVDIGIHYVRAMRLLLGEPDEVSAFQPMQINTRMDGEDGLQALFSSRYGWQGHFLTTWSAVLGRIPDIVVVGDAGTIHLWPMTGYYDYYPVAPRPLVRLLGYVRPYALQAKLIRPAMQRERVRCGGPDDGYVEQMREFLTAVVENRQPVAAAEEGRRDLEIVVGCYEAMDTGRRVAIPPYSPAAR